MKSASVFSVLAALATAFAAFSAGAFLPPEDTRDGVTLRIAWFDEEKTADGSLKVHEVDAGEEVPLQFALSNLGERRVRGELSAWMNDDWKIEGDSRMPITLEPGEQRLVRWRAVPGPRVLDALYPVHATFTTKKFTLHPVAVFRAVPSGSPAGIVNGWDLGEAGENLLAAVTLGTNGLFDAELSFQAPDGRRLVYHGFECEVDGVRVGRVGKVTYASDGDLFTVDHQCGFGRTLRAELWAENGSLRVAWSMPGAERSSSGSPRYTRLALGEGSHAAMRSYAGFGNVLEDPVKFRLFAEGFRLSTRHVGADYANGFSLVQASDIFPDALECDSERRFHSLVLSHDATFTFVPSLRGAFAAARRFAALSGYQAAPGVERLKGLMCLDEWWGDYRASASNLLLSAKYGITDAVFVRHGWQRWGYDYRLPETCPADRPEEFAELREACAKAGYLFCPHDNYIDYYPDAEGFSYDDIVFNADGTPFKAWYNRGRKAQSYRWLPHAFAPRLSRNASMMRKLYDPDAMFIDVFTAIAPFDYLDRVGRFYPKTVTGEKWGEAFDLMRAGLGKKNAPMISEAGTDALIGHLDAGQSDHFSAHRWFDYAPVFSDCERVPWHDIVTHGKFILFAGGLGGRYAAVDWSTPGDELRHGYGSDDYLANTVIGGRAPMAGGSFSRRGVMTYWLLHDVCADLASADFEDFSFDGNNIHRLHSVFSDGSSVWVNRDSNTTWRVEGRLLPHYGFFAKTKSAEAAVVLKSGYRWAYAKGPSGVFVDARGAGPVEAGGVKTDGALLVTSNRKGFMRRHLPFSGSGGEILVTPLPGSTLFSAVIDPVAFGFRRGGVKDVVPVEPLPDARELRWTQKNGVLAFQADGRAFAYRIIFR